MTNRLNPNNTPDQKLKIASHTRAESRDKVRTLSGKRSPEARWVTKVKEVGQAKKLSCNSNYRTEENEWYSQFTRTLSTQSNWNKNCANNTYFYLLQSSKRDRKIKDIFQLSSIHYDAYINCIGELRNLVIPWGRHMWNTLLDEGSE